MRIIKYFFAGGYSGSTSNVVNTVSNPPLSEIKYDLRGNNVNSIETSIGNGAKIGDISGQPTVITLKNNGVVVASFQATGGFSGTDGTTADGINGIAGSGGQGFRRQRFRHS